MENSSSDIFAPFVVVNDQRFDFVAILIFDEKKEVKVLLNTCRNSIDKVKIVKLLNYKQREKERELPLNFIIVIRNNSIKSSFSDIAQAQFSVT